MLNNITSSTSHRRSQVATVYGMPLYLESLRNIHLVGCS